MLRKRSLRTSRRPKISSSTPPSASEEPPAFIQNNRFVPDVSKLASDIGDILLDIPSTSPFADVSILTSDDGRIPANKTMLGIRSSYFRNLFFSRFAEAGASSVSVPLRTEPLTQTIQFVYTGDCSLIHEALKYISSQSTSVVHSKPSLKSIVFRLVDISISADYIHVTQLQQLANETLTALIAAHPSTTCTALEALRRNPMALKFCNPLRLWNNAVRNPRRYFLVPDCLHLPQARTPNNKIEGSDDSKTDETDADAYGVLELSFETLDYLLRFAAPTSDHEYLFQVVYYWGTNGRCVEKSESNCLPIVRLQNNLSIPGCALQSGLPNLSENRLFTQTSPQFRSETNAESVTTTLKTGSLSLSEHSESDTIVNSAACRGNNESSNKSAQPESEAVTSSTKPTTERKPQDSLSPPKHSASKDSERGNAGSPANSADKTVIEKDSSSGAPKIDRESQTSERWSKAMQLANHIDWTHMKPEFIRDFVEQSGLFSKDVLFEAYRYHATRDVPVTYGASKQRLCTKLI